MCFTFNIFFPFSSQVFSHLYSLQLEEDVNEVLFAVHSNMTVTEQNISEAATQLQKLLKLENPERRQSIANMATKIRCLKWNFAQQRTLLMEVTYQHLVKLWSLCESEWVEYDITNHWLDDASEEGVVWLMLMHDVMDCYLASSGNM